MFNPNVIQYTDYFPFGMTMPGKNGGSEYRFGYQGSEKDDEIKGEGNSYATEFRMLDPRIGRWLSVDPVTQPWQSPYCSMDNNPVRYNDPFGDKIINGDRAIADQKKEKMVSANNSLTDFKTSHNISDETSKKDFIKQGGNKKDWKEYKNLGKKADNATKAFNAADSRANITQGIIDRWKQSSPNLYGEVDGQSTDFALFSVNTDEMLETGAFGFNSFVYTGEPANAKPYSKDLKKSNTVSVKIADGVNLTSPDVETGEYSLNHEAGHFLYFIKYTSDYVIFYNNVKANGTYVSGGHGKNDESGKIAEKLGKVKDIVLPAPEIKATGN